MSDVLSRVRAGAAWLDEHAPHWRKDALALVAADGGPLWIIVDGIASDHAPGLDAMSAHDWHLNRGFTIDFSHLGYPPDDGPMPRKAREIRAWAELDATWWEAIDA